MVYVWTGHRSFSMPRSVWRLSGNAHSPYAETLEKDFGMGKGNSSRAFSHRTKTIVLVKQTQTSAATHAYGL